MRDVAFLGLKSILTQLPSGDHNSITIARTNDPKICRLFEVVRNLMICKLKQWNFLTNFARKIGDALSDRHLEAKSDIFLKLDSENPVIRKPAINCLGSVGAVCSDKRFNDMMSVTIDSLTCTTRDIKRGTGVQAVCGGCSLHWLPTRFISRYSCSNIFRVLSSRQVRK